MTKNTLATPWQPPTKFQHFGRKFDSPRFNTTVANLTLICVIFVSLPWQCPIHPYKTHKTLATAQQCPGNQQQHSSIVAGTFAQGSTFVFSSENLKIYIFSCLNLLLHIYIVYVFFHNNHASTVIYFWNFHFIVLATVLQLLWQPKVTCLQDNWSCQSNPSPRQSHGSTYIK